MTEAALLSEPSDLSLGLTDLEKSAVVMLSVGEEAAAEVMKHMTQLEINLLSLAMARPFTLQYAEECVPETMLHSASFIQTNYVLTTVWALAMAVLVLADVGMDFAPTIPRWIELVVTAAVLGGAFVFNERHLARSKAHRHPRVRWQ